MSIHADSTSPGRRAPTIQNRKVSIRRTNAAYRSREYLAEKEVETLMEMETPRKGDRKPLAPEQRRVKISPALVPEAYRALLSIAGSTGESQSDVIGRLLLREWRRLGKPAVKPLSAAAGSSLLIRILAYDLADVETRAEIGALYSEIVSMRSSLREEGGSGNHREHAKLRATQRRAANVAFGLRYDARVRAFVDSALKRVKTRKLSVPECVVEEMRQCLKRPRAV